MNVRSRTLTIAAGLLAGFWPNLALAQLPAKPAAQPSKATPIEQRQAIRFPVPTKVPPVFYLHSYLGKCLDYGTARPPGTQVYVSDYNYSAEQQILVEEVDAQHDVRLHAGNLVLGVWPPRGLPGARQHVFGGPRVSGICARIAEPGDAQPGDVLKHNASQSDLRVGWR